MIPACRACIQPDADEVADGVFQLQHLAHIEIRSGPFELRLVGVVLQSHAEHRQRQVLHFSPSFPRKRPPVVWYVFLRCMSRWTEW